MEVREIAPTVYVPLARLKPAPWNPRKIGTARFENLCQSLRRDPRFLEDRPVLAMLDGTIYAGNQRFRAAEHVGWTLIPARIEDVDPVTARERAIRDNAQWGEWDDDALAELVYSLSQQPSADVLTIGFDEAGLKRLADLSGADGVDPAERIAPDEFKEYGEDIETAHKCPRCGYQFS